MSTIQRAAVLGSGVMGSAIAALLANCGIPSLMLDIVPPGLSDAERRDSSKRNSLATAAKNALPKTKPPPLYRKTDMNLIEIGNFEDDLPRIADCDWIIEVVKEDLDVKRAVFESVSAFRRTGAIVSTNTSGLPLRQMVDVMDEDMRRHFLGTHFFNPPRYMKLLEIIPGPDTLPETIDLVADFAQSTLGKGVVFAKDTPNFIANRILTFFGQYILSKFSKHGLTVQEVDTLTGPHVGHASSATFRTLDLIGLDTYLRVLSNVHENCPDDEHRDLLCPPDWLSRMIQDGRLGQKTGAGFYKTTKERDETGKRVILVLDTDTSEYVRQSCRHFPCVDAAKAASSLEEKVRAMHSSNDPGSRFAWKVFANTAVYAGNRIPEIAEDVLSIDRAAKWGFGWEIGIFETWDVLGVRESCERMEKDGISPPPIARALLDAGHDSFYRTERGRTQFFDLASNAYKEIPPDPNSLTLAFVKNGGGIVKENQAASLIDLDDGILCAEFHTKMNTIDADLLAMLRDGVELINQGTFNGMVIANQGRHFSAGANLFLLLGSMMQGDWRAVEHAVRDLQNTNMALRFCRGPLVAAPHHYTLGGGIELSQHTDRVVVAGETYGGLVEAGVGVIPAGGGSKEMLRRALSYVPAAIVNGDPFPYVRRAFETIGMAKMSTSGPELIDLGYFAEQDVVCVNLDRQVQRAKQVCAAMHLAGYAPPPPATLVALGEPVAAAFRSAVYQMRLGGYATEHDALIAEHLARILTGGDRAPGSAMTEQDVLDLECEAFCSLCGTEKTQQRMKHMLETGKPLRN